MKKIFIYCEGKTELYFVKQILFDYFDKKEIYLIPILCHTKEGPQKVYKGGITSYSKVIRELKKLCHDNKNEQITSFIDYYGLKNLPQLDAGLKKYNLIKALEMQMKADVGCSNYIPYVSFHEFESLLFSDPTKFSYLNKNAVSKFERMLLEFEENPEFINNGISTAPSKRILNLIPGYSKTIDGLKIAKSISLQVIRSKCKHFSEWIRALEEI